MPSSPSLPGRTTASTSSEYASFSGVTISSWSGTSACELRGALADFVDRACQEEGLLGQVVDLAVQDLLEARDGVLDGDVLAAPAGEDLGHEERLAHEPLEAPRTADERLVLRGQLVDAQDRDDVLEVAVALEHALRLLRDVVVILPDDEWVQDARGRRQRIDGGVDPQLGDRPLEADRRVEVGERRRRRRVRVVVGRDEHGLERRDRALLCRRDPLL